MQCPAQVEDEGPRLSSRNEMEQPVLGEDPPRRNLEGSYRWNQREILEFEYP